VLIPKASFLEAARFQPGLLLYGSICAEMKKLHLVLGAALLITWPFILRTMSEKQEAELAVILGLLLLSFVFLVLLDIKNALGKIRDLLGEANDANPHIAHQRDMRSNAGS
jgi:hypothetical protein